MSEVIPFIAIFGF